jgi:hypothetical protein
VEYRAFLPNLRNEQLRAEFWMLFQQFEHEARLLAGDYWVEIRSVVHSDRNDWTVGDIRVDANPGGKGTVAHEVFHSTFHRCPLHDHGEDEHWGEGFCDAFRYFMEKRSGLHHGSEWFNKLDSFAQMTPEAILRKSGDIGYDRGYAIPASQIIQCSDGDFDRFTALWKDLCDKRSSSDKPILNAFFKFAPRA